MQIPTVDRLQNKTAHVDPTLKTGINADLLMTIFDSLVNGSYRFKPKNLTYADIEALTDKEEGEVFYASDIKQFVGWDGAGYHIW
jgi:hypothetical protein